MPEYLTPGVYIEEIERGPRPIEGVPTSTAAFLGETERGQLYPRLITSYAEYRRWFGDPFAAGKFMPHASSGFFDNGGKRLYVCRVVGSNATRATKVFGDFTVTAVGPGKWGRQVWVRIQASSTKDRNNAPIGFRLKLAYWSDIPNNFQPYDPFDPANRAVLPRPQYVEDFDDLTALDPADANYFQKRLTDPSTNLPVSALASIERTGNPGTTPQPNPAAGEFLDSNGVEDVAVAVADFVGAPNNARQEPSGLTALELDPFRDVALVYAPHPPNDLVAINKALIDHCERLRFRFAVIDADRDADPSTLDPRTTDQIDTEYAAVYAPWLTVADPRSGARVDVPPGGIALGVYARTDTERGVWKAPANEIARNALDTYFDVNDNTQGVMNPRGVNAIRKFPGRGIRVWGARTLSSNSLWKYVSVRRLFIFLERSIYEGTQWVVFEPNDDSLWGRVKDTIKGFLRTQWRAGALFGRTEEEAYFIACDRTTMSADQIQNGMLVATIGIAAVKPAEFVLFQIFQNTAESQR